MPPALRLRGLTAIALILVFILGYVSLARAQRLEPTKTESQKEKDVFLLNPFEVISSKEGSYVTTSSNSITRFAADLQAVPISTDIFTADFISDTASTILEDLLTQYGTAAGTFAPTPDNSAGDSQPGLYVGTAPSARGVSLGDPRRDGFAIQNPYFTNTNIWDVERVEVARGPSAGTLYGASGAGGSINMVSKAARFDKISGSFTHRLDSYDSNYLLFDANLGGKNVAGRFALLSDDRLFRQKFIANDYRGLYGQLAFKLPFRSVLRLQGRWTESDRQVNTNTANLLLNGTVNGAAVTDPRQNDSLTYLVATGKGGAINPDTGQPYPRGAIANGRLTWETAQSYAGDARWDEIATKLYGATLDSTWTPWLATSVGAMYLHVRNTATPSGPTLLAPRSWGVTNSTNPYDDWAVGTDFRVGLNGYRSYYYRAAALLTHELFDKKIRTQTSFGWDRTDVAGGTANVHYFKSDAAGNIAVTPGAAGADALGRSMIPNGTTFFTWPVGQGPARNPYLKPGQKTILYNGQYYTLDYRNPRHPRYVGPGNPLGLSSIAVGSNTTGNGLGVNSFPYGNEGGDSGVYITNFSSWFRDRFTTLATFRRSSYRSHRLNADYTGYVDQTNSFDSYSAGLNYSLRRGLNAYYNYGRNFLPTASIVSTSGSRNDPYGNLPVPAYLSAGHEFGLKWLSRDNNLQASVSYSFTDSKKETYNFTSAPQNILNPTGLNGRFAAADGVPGPWIPMDKHSDTWELIVAAQPRPNWRVRLSASATDGTFKNDASYRLLWNDEFHYDAATGGVRYADGSPFLVPTDAAGLATVRALNALRAPVTGATNTPLTVAMMSDPASPYYAYANNAGGAHTISGNIFANNTVYRALRWFNKPTSALPANQALTGRVGLPVSAIPYAYNDPANFQGVYHVARAGDTTFGQAKYRITLTNNYDIKKGRLQGLGVGCTVVLAFDNSTFYYFETDPVTADVTRKLYAAPLVSPLVNFNIQYSKKFERLAFRTQLNVNNVLDRSRVGIIPSGATGYRNEADLNGALFGVPRELVWTNTFSF